MGILIDSCVFIASEREQRNFTSLVEKAGHEAVFISVITAAELLHGVHRAKDKNVRRKREIFVEQILQGIQVLEFDLITSRIYARIWADMAQKGSIISAHDMQIAATALQHQAALLTYNKKDFLRIEGLKFVY